MTFSKNRTKWLLYAHSSTGPWLMHNIPYPMETISAIKKPYIQNDSSWLQEGRSLFFLEIMTVKWHKVLPDCNNNQNSDPGNEHGDRGNHRRMGSGTKVKRKIKRAPQHLPKEMDMQRDRESVCQHPEWTWMNGDRRAAVLWLRACPQICCHEKDTCTVTK